MCRDAMKRTTPTAQITYGTKWKENINETTMCGSGVVERRTPSNMIGLHHRYRLVRSAPAIGVPKGSRNVVFNEWRGGREM